MKLTEIKSIQQFNFSDEKGNWLTRIIMEPIGPGTGRITVYANQKIFTRYLNGCGPNLYKFISEIALESFCGMFPVQYPSTPRSTDSWQLILDTEEPLEETESRGPEDAQYFFLLEHIRPIWSQMVEIFKMPFLL